MRSEIFRDEYLEYDTSRPDFPIFLYIRYRRKAVFRQYKRGVWALEFRDSSARHRFYSFIIGICNTSPFGIYLGLQIEMKSNEPPLYHTVSQSATRNS